MSVVDCNHKRRKYVTIGKNGTIFDCQDHCQKRITMNEIKTVNNLIKSGNSFFPCRCVPHGMPTFDYETVEKKDGNYVSLQCFHCNDVKCLVPDNCEFNGLLTTGTFGKVFEKKVVTNLRQLRPGDEVSCKMARYFDKKSEHQKTKIIPLAKHFFIVSHVDIDKQEFYAIEVVPTEEASFRDLFFILGTNGHYKVAETSRHFVANEFTKYHYLPKDTFKMEKTLRKTRKELTKSFSYGLLINNCQHFTNYCKFGKDFHKNQADFALKCTVVFPPACAVFIMITTIGKTIKEIIKTKSQLEIKFTESS